MVKQKSHGYVATCPKPAGEKQGRQLLSQNSVVSPGQDVTGGLKDVSHVGYSLVSSKQPSRNRVTVNERLNDRPRLWGGAVKGDCGKRPLFEDLSMLLAPLFHASSLAPNSA
jgi:hypothetical protein